MYCNECLSVGKIENGYLIEIRMPYEDESDSPMYERREKVFMVKTAEEAAAKIGELLPLLAKKMTADEEFESIFKEATK